MTLFAAVRCVLRAVAMIAAGVVLGTAVACSRPGGTVRGPTGPPITIPGTEEWYVASEPLALAYLGTLPDSDRGTVLEGIKLSDGRDWFAGFTYLGRAEGLPPGTNVLSFREGEQPLAFMWIDEGGEPLPLTACGSGADQGIRARKLAGQVYAWKAVQPGHGLVFTTCPPDEWSP